MHTNSIFPRNLYFVEIILLNVINYTINLTVPTLKHFVHHQTLANRILSIYNTNHIQFQQLSTIKSLDSFNNCLQTCSNHGYVNKSRHSLGRAVSKIESRKINRKGNKVVVLARQTEMSRVSLSDTFIGCHACAERELACLPC